MKNRASYCKSGSENVQMVLDTLLQSGLPEACLSIIASPNGDNELRIKHKGKMVYSAAVNQLHRLWSLTSYHIQALRDNPACADEEFTCLQDDTDPGLSITPGFKINKPAALINTSRPRIGILREQGVNGHVEMAAAFDRAGFDCIDINMNDLLKPDCLAGQTGRPGCLRGLFLRRRPGRRRRLGKFHPVQRSAQG